MLPIPISKRWIAFLATMGAAYYGWSNYTIQGLQGIRVLPKNAAISEVDSGSGLDPADRMAMIRPSADGASFLTSLPSVSSMEAPTIRVGTFNLHLFGSQKIAKPYVMEALTKICRKFDVLAVQEIAGQEQDLLPILVQKINQSGRRFDYLIGPRVGSESHKTQLGFLFDTDRIETDRFQLYTVEDPGGLIETEPLVAWFRTKTGNPKDAFTFTAVNVMINPNRIDAEIRLLPELLESVHRDGRNEDDCLLLGDFQANDQQLSFLRTAGLEFALLSVPTTTRGEAMADNILFPTHATDEYTGRSGVQDFLREFNLPIDQALEVSDHLPVWAEFFMNEGGQHGRVARSAIH